MKREDIIRIVKEIGNDTIDHLPDLLEAFQPYGHSIGTLVQVIRNGARTIKEVASGCDMEEVQQEIKAEYEKIGVPTYMDCVVFLCSKGMVLGQEQKNILESVLKQEYDSEDVKALQVIEAFINHYMGEIINVGNVDECEIGNRYINFQFNDDGGYREYPYDEDDLNLVMSALNGLLGDAYFDYYLVDGHDESWLGE